MFRKSLTAIALTLGAASGAFAQDLETVVARVGDTEITLGEMLITRMQLPPQYQDIPDEALFDGILNQLIQQQLLADALPVVTPRLEMAIANETRALRAGESVNTVAEAAVNPDTLQAAYDEQYADFEGDLEWNASHILVETEEDAAALIEELEAGADFAALAAEKSTGPSGPSGGALGWFGAGMMVAPFEEAVADMEVGAISAPVETQFGWHVIKLNETRDQTAPTMEEVRPELEGMLINAAIEAELARLEEAATVERIGDIDPAAISMIELLED